MCNNIEYVGTTAKQRRAENSQTMRKSRRLAMKRRRLRRASVTDALGMTPTREERYLKEDLFNPTDVVAFVHPY